MLSARAISFVHETLSNGLKKGLPIRVAVRTESMSPLVRPGDEVVVHPASPSQIRVGDIVLLDGGRDWVAHRYLGRRRQGGQSWLMTRGDRVRRLDAPVPPEALLGRITAVERAGCTIPIRRSLRRRIRGTIALIEVTILEMLRRLKHTLPA
jgi:signal peptidase I